MIKYPYVSDYLLFVRIEIKYAEELLGEYNDFYLYNKTQYEKLFEKDNDSFVVEELEISEHERSEQAEHNAKVSADHFAKLFGSTDFAESAMLGLKIIWYDLQQILLEEFKAKIPVHQSAMNGIAPRLRNLASILLFAERIVSVLEKIEADKAVIDAVKQGFELLVERNASEDLDIPEYHKTKPQLNKIKKAEQYLEFCEKLFFVRA